MLPEKVNIPETIEISKAAELAALFNPMFDKMIELDDEFKEIVESPIGKSTCIKAEALRKKYVKIRTGTAKIHKGAKAYHLQAGKVIDGFKNAQLFAGESNEAKLKEIATFFERREAVKIETLRQDRWAWLELDGMHPDHEPADLGTMEEDMFQTLRDLVIKRVAEAKQAEADEAEARRIADEAALKKIKEDAAAKAVEEERERVAEIERKAKAKEFQEEFVELNSTSFNSVPKAEASFNHNPPLLKEDTRHSSKPGHVHQSRGYDYEFKVTLRFVAETEQEADQMAREYIDSQEAIINSEQY